MTGWKIPIFNRKYIDSNVGFSIAMLVFVGLRMNQTEAFLFLIIVAMVGLVLSMECEYEGAILDNA